MDRLIASNVRRGGGGASTSQASAFAQCQRNSRIVRGPPQTPEPRPPQAHQNMNNLQQFPCNDRGRIPVAHNNPPHFHPQRRRTHRAPLSLQDMSLPRPPSRINHPQFQSLEQQVEYYKEKMQECTDKLNDFYNLLVEKEVKVSNIKKLMTNQGNELTMMYHRVNDEQSKTQTIENRYSGELQRLNDLLSRYRNNVEELRAERDRNDNVLVETLRETLEFMKNVNGDFKDGQVHLTSEYCEGPSEVELEEEENIEVAVDGAAVANETQTMIEQVNVEKDKFKETATVLIEFTEKGFQECLKQIEQLKEENAALKMQLQVASEAQLRASESPISGDDGESGSVSGMEVGDGQGDELENRESLGAETPPPVLYPYDVEIEDTSGPSSGRHLTRVKRRREVERSIGNVSGLNEEGDHEGENGGQKKTRKDSEGITISCEMLCGQDSGEQLTLHYVAGDEDVQDENNENAVVPSEAVTTQQEGVKKGKSSISLSGDQREKSFEEEWECSKFFCERCFTPFPNQQKLDRHFQKKPACSNKRERHQKWKLDRSRNSENNDGSLRLKVLRRKNDLPEHYEEGELFDI